MAKKNPNARASLVAGLVASAIVWGAHKAGWTLQSYYATLAATAVVSGVLWLGRDVAKIGVGGIFAHLWHGKK